MLNNSLNIKVRGKKKKKDEILVASMNLAECTVGFLVVVFGFLQGQKTFFFFSYINSCIVFVSYSMIVQKYMQRKKMRN